MFGKHERDPWAFERPIGSDPDRPVDARLAAVVPLPADSMEWLGTIQSYTADGYSLLMAVRAANIAYPVR